MNKTRNKIIHKDQRFITLYTVFVVWWWSLGGFLFAFNGFFQSVLAGRFGLAMFVIYVITYFIGRSHYPSLFINDDKKTSIFFLIINLIIYIISFIIGGRLVSGDFVILAFLGWAILTFNIETRIKIFDLFLKLSVTLLCLSIIEFSIFAITGNGIILGVVERKFAVSGGSQTFIQTLFNYIDINADIPRFQSLYEEPGGVGNVAILFLFLTGNNPRYRFAHIISWISGIVSFSLGFYLLAAIYVLGQNIKIKYLLWAGLFLIVFANVPFIKDRFDQLIVYRVQDRSVEEIDDRSNDILDAALVNSVSDGTIWFGHGGVLPDSFQYYSGVSGAKPFIYKYGIIMTIITLAFYIIVFMRDSTRSKMLLRKRLVFILFFGLSFYKSAVLFQPYFVLMYFLYPFSQIMHLDETNNINNKLKVVS